ncbi:NAD(+) diphosphatase [Algimonas porphyrae]|nr:NAD(+) diphosphatase [Algimonas porphyrae]
MPDCPIPFAGSQVDFAELHRSEAKLAELQAESRASTILLHKGQVASDGPQLLRAAPAQVAALPLYDPGLIFLGFEGDGDPVFAASLRDDSLLPPDALIDLRLQGHRLAADALALAGRARSIFDWHRTHPFCAQCGQATVSSEGGAKRVCGACETEHFPRVNPVVIFLIEHEDSVLLGRGHGWPPGFYSALAGFVSPGETIEEAASREGLEEVGAVLSGHRYLFCQPWPFPSQLMIGLVSQARDKRVTIDKKELEDARWFSRADVSAVFSKTGEAFMRPPRTTIAHQLLKAWLGSASG